MIVDKIWKLRNVERVRHSHRSSHSQSLKIFRLNPKPIELVKHNSSDSLVYFQQNKRGSPREGRCHSKSRFVCFIATQKSVWSNLIGHTT